MVFFKNQFTYLSVKNQEFKISFREKMTRVIVPGKFYNHSELHPVNILCFRTEYFGQKEYKDGKQLLVQEKANTGDPITENLRNWLEWAKKKADWYDPFKVISDDLLADVDMVTLTFKEN